MHPVYKRHLPLMTFLLAMLVSLLYYKTDMEWLLVPAFLLAGLATFFLFRRLR